MADSYVEMVTTTGIGDIRTHPWLKAAIDAFATTVAPIGPVLDVGCGPGMVTAYLAERDIEVTGIDLSSRCAARRVYRDRPPIGLTSFAASVDWSAGLPR